MPGATGTGTGRVTWQSKQGSIRIQRSMSTEVSVFPLPPILKLVFDRPTPQTDAGPQGPPKGGHECMQLLKGHLSSKLICWHSFGPLAALLSPFTAILYKVTSFRIWFTLTYLTGKITAKLLQTPIKSEKCWHKNWFHPPPWAGRYFYDVVLGGNPKKCICRNILELLRCSQGALNIAPPWDFLVLRHPCRLYCIFLKCVSQD